jgi:hypothetical protein
VGEDIAAANLVIDGSSVSLALDDGELLSLVRKGQGVLNVMNLGQCQAELDERVKALHDGEGPATTSAHPAAAAR